VAVHFHLLQLSPVERWEYSVPSCSLFSPSSPPEARMLDSRAALCAEGKGRLLFQFAGPTVSTTATTLTELSRFPYLPNIHFNIILQSMTIIFVTLQYTLQRAAQANALSAPVHCPNIQFSFPYYFTLTHSKTANLKLSFLFRFPS
jgi:hypothetical protein